MIRFVLAVLAVSVSANLADAQFLRKVATGQRPVLSALSGSCGAAGGVGLAGSCGSAVGACQAGDVPWDVGPAVGVRATAAPVESRTGRTALFYDLVRAVVAKKAHEKGVSRAEAHAAAQSLTNAMIDGAMTHVKVPVGVLGDGHILQILLDFLSSPVGQMLLNLLLSLLGL